MRPTESTAQAAKETNSLQVVAQERFVSACEKAAGLNLANNFGAVFEAAAIIHLLRDALSDEIMTRFIMPLMNTRIGFLTDKDPSRKDRQGKSPIPYDLPTVRDAIIDAVTIGLRPVGNQMNIIAGRMYPTKEGYTALLKKLGVRYILEVGINHSKTQDYAEIPVKVSYQHGEEKNSFTVYTTVKRDQYSSYDQLKGKAERRAKKALYEYITGCDFGEADEYSSTIDIPAEEVKEEERKPEGNTPTEAEIGRCIKDLYNLHTTAELELFLESLEGSPILRSDKFKQSYDFRYKEVANAEQADKANTEQWHG